jgi:hypothetical protein
MFGGVLVSRTVAATHVTAGPADAQVNPFIARSQAFLAAPSARGYVSDPFNVGAQMSHGSSEID